MNDATALAGRCALVVEDHALSAKLVSRMLELAGCEVRIASRASEASVALMEPDASPPDVIVLDLDLPLVDGLAFARFVRSLPSLRDISIIAVSAAREGDEARRAEAAGCDAYVAKPLERDAFVSLVRDVVDRTQ